MNEAETRAEHIDPALREAPGGGWSRAAAFTGFQKFLYGPAA